MLVKMEEDISYLAYLSHGLHLASHTVQSIGGVVTGYLKTDPQNITVEYLIDLLLTTYDITREQKNTARIIRNCRDYAAKNRGASSLFIQLIDTGSNYNTAPPELLDSNGFLPETTAALPLFERDCEEGMKEHMMLHLLVFGPEEWRKLQSRRKILGDYLASIIEIDPKDF